MRTDISNPKQGSPMWKTVAPAAAVLTAAAVIRRKLNALHAATFPLPIAPRVQLRPPHTPPCVK